jgi:hypothetical protein
MNIKTYIARTSEEELFWKNWRGRNFSAPGVREMCETSETDAKAIRLGSPRCEENPDVQVSMTKMDGYQMREDARNGNHEDNDEQGTKATEVTKLIHLPRWANQNVYTASLDSPAPTREQIAETHRSLRSTYRRKYACDLIRCLRRPRQRQTE